MELILQQTNNVSNVQCWVNKQTNRRIGIAYSDICSIQLDFSEYTPYSEILRITEQELLSRSLKQVLFN